MTATHLYKLDAKFIVNPKRTVDLNSIKSINVSKFKDGVVILRSKTEGMDSAFSMDGALGESGA